MGFKPPEEKKAGAPEWMVTYTDLMSLLMVFFILLLTFSTPRMEKLFELQGSISGSFGIVMGHPDDRESEVEPSHLLLGRDLRNPYAPATPPRFLPMEQRDPNVDLSRLKDQTGEAIAFETIAEGHRIIIGDAIRYRPGDRHMDGASFARLAKVAAALAHYDRRLVVVGHVGAAELDAVRLRGAEPLDLALARAVAVAERLVEHHGLAAARIGVAGYGPTPGDTGVGRVELILADRGLFESP